MSAFSKLGFWEVSKLVVAFICLIAAAVQFISCARQSIAMNNPEIHEPISSSDLEFLSAKDKITGQMPDYIMTYPIETEKQGVTHHCFVVLTESKKLLVFKAAVNNPLINELIEQHRNGETETVEFRGRIHSMSTNEREILGLNLVANNIQYTYKLGNLQQAILPYEVELAIVISNERLIQYIVITFIGGLLMLLIAGLCLKKTIKNFIYSVKERRGTAPVPDPVVTQDDITFELEGYYEDTGDYEDGFYVNSPDEIMTQERREEMRRKVQERMTQAAIHARQETVQETVPQPRQDHTPSETDYFSSGVNEEGNFYVETHPAGSKKRRKRY